MKEIQWKSWSVPDLITETKLKMAAHVNKGKIHQSWNYVQLVSSGRCGKLDSIKWGIPEPEVNN